MASGRDTSQGRDVKEHILFEVATEVAHRGECLYASLVCRAKLAH